MDHMYDVSLKSRINELGPKRITAMKIDEEVGRNDQH